MCSHLTLGPLLQGQIKVATFKILITHLLLIVEIWNVNQPKEIMGWESSDIDRFFHGSLLQGQMMVAKLKHAYNSHIICPRLWDVNSIHRKSWAGNLLIWSDLILGPSFKVKRGYRNLKGPISGLLLLLDVWGVNPTYRKSRTRILLTGFGGLFFWWVQFASVLRLGLVYYVISSQNKIIQNF